MTSPVTHTFRDPDLERAFRRDGFVVVDFLSSDEVATLLRCWAELQDPTKSYAFSVTVMSTERAYRERVNAAIEAIFAPKQAALLDDYRFCHGNFITKQPGMSDGEVLLHQDQSFVDDVRFVSANFWVPLIDVDRASGCLHVVRGSQTLNPISRGSYRAFPYPDLLPTLEQRFLTYLPMRAGQACIMNPAIFHGSRSNRASHERVAVGTLSIPRESRLRYFHQDEAGASDRVELYDVPDDFYVRHVFGRRPEGIASSGVFESKTEPLSIERLEATCAGLAPRS